MTKVFKPLLAVACEDVTKLNYPMLLSEKLDGIRMSVHNGVCMSRSMKPIPSTAVQAKFGRSEYEGYDGEIIYGDKNAKDVFNKSTRACMSHKFPEELDINELKFYVFDQITDDPYKDRWWYIRPDEQNQVIKLRNFPVNSPEEVQELEVGFLAMGAEGVMLRSPEGRYKQGRSTLKEGILLKVKQFVDEEATIIDFEEKMHNANEATVGELGQTKRSSHQENMIPCGTLGALVVHSEKWGSFKIGTGFNDQQRQEIWDNKDKYDGQLVKFKYFAVGIVDKPRFPVYIGIRHEDDM
jgi:DNA ligase 1